MAEVTSSLVTVPAGYSVRHYFYKGIDYITEAKANEARARDMQSAGTSINSGYSSSATYVSGSEPQGPQPVKYVSGSEPQNPTTTSLYEGKALPGATYTPVAPAAPPPPPVTSAPVAITPEQKAANDTRFYADLQAAKDQAKAGNPTPLRNLNSYLGLGIPEEEFSQSFYYGSTPNEQINLINNMPITQELKIKLIAENLAIQAGARETDSVDNMLAWFNAGEGADPRTVAYTDSSAQNRNNVINATNLSQEIKTKIIQENLAIQAGVREPDSVQNLVAWFNAGQGTDPRTANWASSASPENQIAVVNATNISQDSKNRVIAEIQAGSNLSDSVSDKISWIERGNPPSAGALAILNPPPPAVTAPEPVPVAAPSVSIPDTVQEPNADVSTANSTGSETDASSTATTTTTTESETTFTGTTGSQATRGEFIDSIRPIGTDASSNSSNVNQNTENEAMSTGSSDEHRRDEEAHAKATAAKADADEKQAAALAIATENKASAKENRLKKIMAMRKPWSSGAAAKSNGSESMVAPTITPASQVPPPPL